MRKMSLKEIYCWVIFGTFLSALGPSVFKKMLDATGMNLEFGVVLFLLFGSVSALVVYMADNSTKLRKNNIELNKTETFKLIFCGLLVAGQFWFFTIGMTKGTVTETTMAVRISPFIAVFFGSWFLNEKVNNRKNLFLATVFCLGGFFLMQDIGSLRKLEVPSMIWGAASALALAGKNTISSSLVKKHHEVPNAIVVIIGMFIGGMAMMSVVDKGAFIVPSGSQLLILLFLGAGTIAIPSWINNHAFKETNNMGAVTFFSFLLPVLGGVCAHFVNGESGFNYPKMLFSLLLITIGIYLINKKKERR